MSEEVFDKDELQALELLARGGARYGTRIAVMKRLKDRGLCCAYDNGQWLKKGRWTWRPTPEGRRVIARLGIVNPITRHVGAKP